MKYFVTAIGTDSGKTVVSAILCEAFGADYWKPVQAGLPSDTNRVRELLRNNKSALHPERFRLKTPASPHAAAGIDGVKITLNDFRLPDTTNHLIVEGAGGCLVPLNDRDVVADLIRSLGMDVILVSNHYLGSINHTLLTVEALTARGLAIRGIVFNGNANPETERIILLRTGLRCILRLNTEPLVDREMVRRYALQLKESWNE